MSKHGIALRTMSTSLTESKLSIASWHSTLVAKSEKQHVKKVYEISISSKKKSLPSIMQYESDMICVRQLPN